MATLIRDLIPVVRDRLIEPQPNFWGDDELVKIMANGIRDLWRSIVDLKQEHYLTRDNTNVSLPASTDTFTGLPTDIHKIYMIEARDLSTTGPNRNLTFSQLDYNHLTFQSARGMDPVDPSSTTIYYCPTQAGGPVGAPTIYVAPKVTSAVLISFTYVPTLGTLTGDSSIPIPGEADNAITAWTTAFAMAKEREDRAPNQAWLGIYATEKQNLMQSLGLRDYQEATIADAFFADYW